MAMPDITMYVFTGFLESGKTKFIQETLEDERFNTGERTLLLVFEEGEEEYDVSTYPHKEVYEQVLDYEDLSPEMLTDLQKKYRAERVVVELNGMHLAADFYLKTPDHWKIAQEVMFADASTFLSYNANMRQLVVDKLAGAEMLVLNRMAPGTDVMPYRKIARAVNRKIDILYEYTDGSTHYDDIEDPLPFDLNAPVIEIKDEDYALFYRDITEEPKKYAGKTVKFKGQVARLRREKEGMFAPGRFVMTCCEADITFMGLPCKFAAASGLAARSWVWVTATVEVKFHTLYKGVGPILTAVNVQPAEPAEQEEAIPDEQPEAPEISSEEIKNFLASDEVKSALREAGLDENEIEDMTENPELKIKYITRAEYERMRIDDAMIGFMYGVEAFSIALEGILGIFVSTPLFLAFPIVGPFLVIIFNAGAIPITVGAFAAGVGLTVASPVIVLVRYINYELPDYYVVVK